VRECEPVIAKDVVKAAVPVELTVAVPIAVVPSLKVTLPLGPVVLLLWELIITDRVTCWFAGTGLALSVKAVVVVAGVTVILRFRAGLAL
jgi:hypothetical protein